MIEYLSAFVSTGRSLTDRILSYFSIVLMLGFNFPLIKLQI